MRLWEQKDRSVQCGEFTGTEQKMFNASLRIGIKVIPPLVLRYENGLQTIKIGVFMPTAEEISAPVPLLLFEIKSSVYLITTPMYLLVFWQREYVSHQPPYGIFC